MSDEKAERIRQKVTAARSRTSAGNAGQREGKPRKPPGPQRTLFDRALDDHPLALLAGGLALGAVASVLLPRSFGSKLGSRVLGIAALAAELGSVYGSKALDAAAAGARDGRDRLEDLGENLADQGSEARRQAIRLGTIAGKRVIELAGVAARNARGAGDDAVRALSDLRDRARH